MKTYIICNSKTGFTRQYADWIAEETGGTVLPYKELAKAAVGENDTVIFGSRVHVGRVEHLDKVKPRFANRRHFIVYATGGMPGHAQDAIKEMWANSLPGGELGAIPHFYMPGGMCYEKMGAVERALMKTMARVMGKQAGESGVDAEFAARLQSSYDISSREYIKPLVDYVKANTGREN